MFLTKNLSELEKLTNSENRVIQEYDVLKKYLITRLQMDEDLKSFNANQTIIKKDKAQTLWEDGVSVYRIDTAIKMFKKFNGYDSDIKQSADNIFNLIVNDLGSRYKPTYMNSEKLIKEYINYCLEMNKEKILFKETQKLELDVLKNEIYDCGFIPKILNNVYTNIKLSISSYTALCESRYNMYISEEMNRLQQSLALIDELFGSSNKEELRKELYSYNAEVCEKEPKLKDFRVDFYESKD